MVRKYSINLLLLNYSFYLEKNKTKFDSNFLLDKFFIYKKILKILIKIIK